MRRDDEEDEATRELGDTPVAASVDTVIAARPLADGHPTATSPAVPFGGDFAHAPTVQAAGDFDGAWTLPEPPAKPRGNFDPSQTVPRGARRSGNEIVIASPGLVASPDDSRSEPDEITTDPAAPPVSPRGNFDPSTTVPRGARREGNEIVISSPELDASKTPGARVARALAAVGPSEETRGSYGAGETLRGTTSRRLHIDAPTASGARELARDTGAATEIHAAETAIEAAARARGPAPDDTLREIDINATIVSKRASTAAEHLRDRALEKVRDGTHEDLLKTVDVRRDDDAKRRSSSDLRRSSGDLPLSADELLQRVEQLARDLGSPGAIRSNADLPLRADELARDPKAADLSVRAGRNLASPNARGARDDDATRARERGTAAHAGPDDVAALDDLDHALVARLRALPADGTEPDWGVLEATIRATVRDQPMYAPWWKRWQYLVPLGALAATAMIALIVIKASDRGTERTSRLTSPRDAGVSERADPIAPEPARTLWLDGEPLDLDEIEAAALDEIAPATFDDPENGAGVDDNGDDESTATDGAGHGGILPVADFGWIDTLDDAAVARAESWLARKRS